MDQVIFQIYYILFFFQGVISTSIMHTLQQFIFSSPPSTDLTLIMPLRWPSSQGVRLARGRSWVRILARVLSFTSNGTEYRPLLLTSLTSARFRRSVWNVKLSTQQKMETSITWVHVTNAPRWVMSLQTTIYIFTTLIMIIRQSVPKSWLMKLILIWQS